jgi:2-dehydro-3-deoxygluconokinase
LRSLVEGGDAVPEGAPATPRFEVTALGETMLRLGVPVGHRLEDAEVLSVHPGGAESNVCAALAGLGRRCGWVSRLPDGPQGRLVMRRLRAAGIDVSAVVLAGGARIGVYYVEHAVPPRPTRVVYDRAGSAVAAMGPEAVDWDYLLDTKVLHLTGITPALGEGCREIVAEAIGRARAAGVAVSFDVNFRSLLWSEREAAEALRLLLRGVDLLICGREDARRLFGFGGEAREVLGKMRSLTDAPSLVLTLGGDGAAALDGDRLLRRGAFPAGTVDRFGAGDAFAAGVIDGLLDGSLEEGLDRGTALGGMALSQAGDMLVVDRAEMEAVLESPRGGLLR